MSRSGKAAASALALFVVLPFVARGSQSGPVAGLVLTGELTVTSSADGRITLVAVDLDTTASPEDGLVPCCWPIRKGS